jgi:outer membrane autotransporter protein
MARHSRRHRRLRESANGTSTPQVLTKPKRPNRHVGLRPSTALACSVIAIVQVAALLPAHAQTIWTGNTSSNWFTGGNWQGGAAPTLATNASLDTIVPNPTVVNGPGAQALDLVVGASFTGALTIGSGGTVANTDGSLGFSSGSTGTVTVAGAGATWTNSGNLYIGRNGTGSLNIASGGTVSNVVGHVGGCSGCSTNAFGTVTVNGAGSTWTNSSALVVGDSGTGQVTISGGGQVLTGSAGGYLGNSPGSAGTMTVTDPGSIWNISGQLVVGGFLGPALGSLTVQNGGTVTNTEGNIGYSSGSTGIATVSGSGATWTNSGDLYIGRNGTGSLNIASGGTVSNVVGRVGGCDGCSTSAVGTVTVSGAGTTWTNSAGLAIGDSGTGQVTIAASGKVLTGSSGGFLGVLPGANGTMMVTDPGSTWNISDQLTVGGSGSGMLIVQNGGTVTNTAGTIGFSSGSIGAVSVTGTSSAWTSSGNVTVGLAGTGTLTVAGGGAVNVGGGTGAVVVADQAGSIGTLNIGAAPGNTAVAPGTLNAAAVQFGAGTGALNFNHTSSGYVFAPTITGPGAVNVFAGTTIFTGNNAYTGGTTINGGTLQLGNGGTSGNISGNVANNGTFAINRSDAFSFANVISGSGMLQQLGPGTTILTTANTYTGGTTVSAGTLRLGSGGSLAPTGALTVNGGTFDLNSNNQTVGALSGTGGILALGNGTLTTDTASNTTLASAITGTGSLTKQGLGTLNLTGTNTYTGPTSVTAGTLAVNGSLTSNVTVGAAGTLGGNGTITGLVTNNGIIAPGNSIGTLTINGNFVQNAGTIYQVQVNPAGQSDRINTSGTATINGGMVQVQAQSGTYARNTTYTILNATGGVSGAYSSVTSNFAFLTPSLSYDANNVYLLLFQNQGAFAAGAQTPNQYAVGTVLDRVNATATGDLNNVLNALSLLSNTQGPAALNAISGQPYADFGTMNVNNAAMFMNALGQQMANARGTASTGQRQALAQACEIESCDGTGPLSAWFSALGGLGSVLGDSNASTFTYNLGGAAAGIDYRFDPRFLAGIGVGYTHGTQWVNSFQGQGWSDSVSVAAYGSFTQSGFYLDALAGYAYSGNQLQRQILIPGLQQRTATGSTGANQFLGQAEGGYKVDIYAPAQASITPFGRLQISNVTQNAFSESGAQSLSLNVAQQTTNSLRTTIGADLGGSIGLGNERKLDLAIRLGWQHEFADTGRPITAAFAGAPGNSFTVFGATPAHDSAVVGLQATTNIAAATQVYLRYDGGVGGGTDNHALNVGVRFGW